jgi:hypothetical protein
MRRHILTYFTVANGKKSVYNCLWKFHTIASSNKDVIQMLKRHDKNTLYVRSLTEISAEEFVDTKTPACVYNNMYIYIYLHIYI